MILLIPLAPIPAQRFTVILDGQDCTLVLRQKYGFLYLDLWVGDAPVRKGAICQHGADAVRDGRGIFSGTLHFVDTLGADTRPEYSGLDTRYALLYASDEETLPDVLRY